MLCVFYAAVLSSLTVTIAFSCLNKLQNLFFEKGCHLMLLMGLFLLPFFVCCLLLVSNAESMFLYKSHIYYGFAVP